MRDSFLVFGSPQISEDEIQSVVETLRSGWIGTGPRVHEFQSDFASYTGAAHAVALGSCTAALHLALLAEGFGAGDEVITSPMTFCATVNAIIHCGATPVFADCERDSFNISPAEIEKKITPRTRAIVPIHFAGRPCDMDAVCAIAQKHNLKIIEDCAHAIETQIRGQHAGTFGDYGCFSFYVTKNVVTGEGGMVVTNDTEKADEIKILGLHGMTRDAWKRFGDEGFKHYQVVTAGFKYNMTDMQAALGVGQLQKVEAHWQRRREIWARYQNEFADLPVARPLEAAADTRHAYHLYTLLIGEEECGISRDAMLDALAKRNIGAGVHYTALHTHPYYRETFDLAPDDFPNALHVGTRTISLPLSAKLSDRDVQDVIDAVRDVLSEASSA
ncbi:MAG TPA: DegT/DnrJ/EryC1/StrS family aminotransferase [Abditibacteriaceae bacterium]|jgi:dTDP-4-amino-4,6-dideoxygalactose transaminase